MKNKQTFSPELLIIDSFCGAGGVTEGFEEAEVSGRKIAMVIVGINHDRLAIESHIANHPETLHFVEDMRTLNLNPVIQRLHEMKLLYPNAKVIFHASLECTNFSRAKGGMARDADSRTLAEHLYRYVEALDPDYITIENVTEFMSWGPLDKNGKPISRDNGKSWTKWRKKINAYGYYDQWVQMNSANYGAYTSRNRLFGMFAKHDLPIVFPEATHSKKIDNELFASLKKWKPVREVLELQDKGNSIFERKKDSDMSSNWYLAHFSTFEETNLKSNAKYLTKIFFKCICNIHTTIKRTYRTNLFNIFRFNITGFILISKY